MDDKCYEISDIPDSITFSTYSVRKKGGTIEYAIIPLSYDSETTSAYTDGFNIFPRQEYRTNKKGQQVPIYEKIAYPYAFMLGFNNKCYLTRSVNELKEGLDKICFLVGSRKIICYIHNAPFDFAFICNFIPFTNVFALKEGKPIKFDYRNIEFRCSYIFDNRSLDKLGEDVGIPKLKSDFNYKKFRTPETPLTDIEKRYCAHDVLILNKYYTDVIYPQYILNKAKVKIPLTKTGKVREYEKKLIQNKQKYQQQLSLIWNTKHEQDMCYLAFRGGWVHGAIRYVNKDLNNIIPFDLTSDYPSQCLKPNYPTSPWIKCKVYHTDIDIDMNDNYCYLFHIIFENVKCKGLIPIISSSKLIKVIKPKYDNGMILKADTVEMVCTGEEIKLISMYYDFNFTVLEKLKSMRGYLPAFILKSIDIFYSNKKKYKNIVKELRKNKAPLYDIMDAEKTLLYYKEMLNSIYGMMVTNPCKDIITWDATINKWVCEHQDYGKKWSDFLAYQWGVWVTASARYELLSMIHLIESKYPGAFVYGDTDSIKCLDVPGIKELFENRNKEISKQMKSTIDKFGLSEELSDIGIWDQEEYVYTFKFLGAKRYIADNMPTVAGVSKDTLIKYAENKSKEVNQILFDGLKLDPLDSDKLTSDIHYTDTVKRYKVYNDNEFIDIGSFIHLEPTTFSVSMGQQYRSIAEEVQQLIQLENVDILGML